MKISFKNGKVSAVAENLPNIKTLVGMVENGDASVKRAYHVGYKRACPKCGIKLQGAKGVALHIRKSH